MLCLYATSNAESSIIGLAKLMGSMALEKADDAKYDSNPYRNPLLIY